MESEDALRMGRRATRNLSLQFVLRTFARLRMIAARYGAGWLAKELAPYSDQLCFPCQYASDILDYMGRGASEPPNGNCAQCGREIMRDSNAARYCSARCRQRAYRLRLKGPGQPKKRNGPAVCDASIAA